MASTQDAVSVDRHDSEDEHVHSIKRSPWLRAAMMGMLDGLLSVASVMLGVGGGTGNLEAMRLAGVAAWVAGALSMFLGEYASVAAQRDSEHADVEKERQMQGTAETRAHELEELAQIYVNRGLCYDTAKKVAEQLSASDVIKAHARDELGIDLDDLANPLQAGLVDMGTFTLGAAVPLLAGSFLSDNQARLIAVAASSVLACALSGFLAAKLSGVKVAVGTARVVVVGTVTLAATYGVGYGFSKLESE